MPEAGPEYLDGRTRDRGAGVERFQNGGRTTAPTSLPVVTIVPARSHVKRIRGDQASG
jgi:hypothetical protein